MTDEPSLQPPGTREQVLKAFFYHELLEHEPFRQALLDVFRALDGLHRLAGLAARPSGVDTAGLRQLGAAQLLALARADGRAAAEQTEYARRAGAWARRWADVPEPLDGFGEGAARRWLRLGTAHLRQAATFLAERARALATAGEITIVDGFCRRWPLPATAGRDIEASYRVWRAAGRPEEPLLLPAAIVAQAPPVPPPAIDVTVRSDWNPGRHAAKAFENETARILARVREELSRRRRALEAAYGAAGWERLPPKWHDSDTLATAAKRLALRALHRRSWGAIAAATGAVTRSTVAEQVTALARRLGILLQP